jgi:hypothetical protein
VYQQKWGLFAATASYSTFTAAFTIAFTFHVNDFSASVCGNFIEFAFANALGVDLQITTLNTDYAETGLLLTFVGTTTLSDEYFHDVLLGCCAFVDYCLR